MFGRTKAKVIRIGDRCIGGDYPIAIQSMCNTKTEDVKATVAQILALEAAGCEIIRVAVPTMEAAEAITEIKKQIHIRWRQTFILTTVWLLRPLNTGLTKSVSIRAISAVWIA